MPIDSELNVCRAAHAYHAGIIFDYYFIFHFAATKKGFLFGFFRRRDLDTNNDNK